MKSKDTPVEIRAGMIVSISKGMLSVISNAVHNMEVQGKTVHGIMITNTGALMIDVISLGVREVKIIKEGNTNGHSGRIFRG